MALVRQMTDPNVPNSVLDDVERLENRLRTNFFEVEKRLSNLEGNLTTTSIDEIKERLQEIEDLQMLLQAEFLQLKQQPGLETAASGGGDVEKRVEKIEEIVSRGVPVAVQKDIETRLERVEKSSNAYEIKKMIDSLESRMRSVPSVSGGSVDISPFLKRLEAVEKGARDPSFYDSLARRVESLERSPSQKSDLSPILKRMESLERTVEERTDNAGLMKRIDFNESMIKDTRAYYSKKITELEDSIERSGKILTEEGMKGFLNRIYETKNEISRKVEQFESAKERLDKLVRERQDLINKLEQSEVNLSKADAILIKIRTEAAKLQSLEERLGSMEQRANNTIKDRIGDMEAIRSEIFDRMRKINDKVSADIEKSSSLREEIVSRLESEVEKSGATRREMETSMENLRNSLEKMDRKYSDMDIENRLQMGVAELNMKFDRMAAETEKAIKSRLDEIESMSRDSEKALKTASEIEKKISSKAEILLRNEKTGNIDERLDVLRKSYMDEAQKQWAEIRNIRDSLKAMEHVKGTHSSGTDREEIQRQWNEIRKIDDSVRNLESRVIAMNPNAEADARKLLEEIRKIAESEKMLESRVETGFPESELKDEIRKLEGRLDIIDSRMKESGKGSDAYYESASKAVNDSLRKFSSSLETRMSAMQKGIYSKLRQEIAEELSRKPVSASPINLDPVIDKIASLEREVQMLERSLRSPHRNMPLIIE